MDRSFLAFLTRSRRSRAVSAYSMPAISAMSALSALLLMRRDLLLRLRLGLSRNRYLHAVCEPIGRIKNYLIGIGNALGNLEFIA